MAVDWSGCPLVERAPDKVSGQWILKGTRILADAVVDNADEGYTAEALASEIYEGLPVGAARAILSFARRGFVSRILLDQNAPVGLRDTLPGHEVSTVCQMGWSALSNAELIAQAETAGFDVLVTCDHNMRAPLGAARRKIALVMLSTSNWNILRENPAPILRSIDHVGEGSFHIVAFPSARPPKRQPSCDHEVVVTPVLVA